MVMNILARIQSNLMNQKYTFFPRLKGKGGIEANI
jgi:hypothetical protein